MPSFQVSRRKDGKYYYQFSTDTEMNMLSSDGYVEKKDCMIAINLVKTYINERRKVIIEQLTNEYYRFIILGTDRSVLGYSLPLRTKKQCDMWIDFLREYLSASSVIEIN